MAPKGSHSKGELRVWPHCGSTGQWWDLWEVETSGKPLLSSLDELPPGGTTVASVDTEIS